MKTFPEIKQGSPEWHALRSGKPTASEFDKVVTSTGKTSTQRQAYLYRLAGERILGTTEQTFESGWMTRGKTVEEEARDVYAFESQTTVEEVGFCLHDSGLYGCSPDGLVGEDGGLEIKCPSLAVFVKYVLGGKVPTEYVVQVQGSLLVTGRDWWDFSAYYPGMNPLMVRVYPDGKLHEALSCELTSFCEELDELEAKLRSL